VGVKVYMVLRGQRDERAVGLVCPCCSRDEASRKIPIALESTCEGGRDLKSALISPGPSSQKTKSTGVAIHDNEIIIGGADDSQIIARVGTRKKGLAGEVGEGSGR
jgi:hypothetical protein